jgi:glycosyltransferase involved in cell wall biosynthesis
MRILILTGIFPPDIGGPATQLDPLIKEFLRAGFRVSVLTFGSNSKQEYPYSVKKINRQTPQPFRSLLYIQAALFMSWGVDAVYCWDLYTPGLAGFLIKKILRKKLVVRFVGDSAWESAYNQGLIEDDILRFQENKYSFGIELRKHFRRSILLAADLVIVVSKFLKRLTQRIGVEEEKIKIIYNSVEFLFEKPELKWNREECRRQLHLGSGKMIITVSRLVKWKALDPLIQIMPDLLRRFENLRLVVVGVGPELGRLKALAKAKGLENAVLFTGRLSHQEIIRYLKCADLFVLNTNYEGLSHTILEAMESGLPVITTKTGGNPELIENNTNGILVDYNNKDQFYEAINRLLDDPPLAKNFIENSKQKLSQFSWPRLVKEHIDLFNEL